MIPTFVYDENILESVMAAAIISTEKRATPVERKTLLKLTSNFWFWCNVIPTKNYFQNASPEAIKAKRHVVIANTDKDTPMDGVIPSAVFVHGAEDSKGQNAPVRYGSMNILERSLAFFNINQTKYIGVIDMVRNFYKKDATIEELVMTVLNVKKALQCLKSYEDYKFISSDCETAENAWETLGEMNEVLREAIDNRCLAQEVISKDPRTNVAKPTVLYTFFENNHWWFIQRLLVIRGLHYRNFTCGLTGNVVISDTNYVEDFKNLNPVVVH